jgi:hypothetical protein
VRVFDFIAKVHGITTADTQETSNENSDTYCSLCKKDFSTKYFYLFHMHTVHNESNDPAYQTFIEFLKTASTINEQMPSVVAPLTTTGKRDRCESLNNNSDDDDEPDDDDDDDDDDDNNNNNENNDGNDQDDQADSDNNRLARKRTRSHSSTDNVNQKRLNSLMEMNNGGLQPFLLESEDPTFSHTFVPCMVYLPVIRRVTKQVKINLRLKPVLTDAST